MMIYEVSHKKILIIHFTYLFLYWTIPLIYLIKSSIFFRLWNTLKVISNALKIHSYFATNYLIFNRINRGKKSIT